MKTNEITKSKKISLLIAVAIMSVLGCGAVSAQNCPCSVSAQNGERLPAGFYPVGSPEYISILNAVGSSAPSKSFFRESSDVIEVIGGAGCLRSDFYYEDNLLSYIPADGNCMVDVMLTIPKPMDLVYSLYTYKPTFKQDDGRRYDPPYVTSPSYEATVSCYAGIEFKTQKDIDDNLDKIYEFAPIRETESGYRRMDWNGKASGSLEKDSKGKEYFKYDANKPGGVAIRDCVLVAAHDTTGKFIGMYSGGDNPRGYGMMSWPGVKYTPIQGAVRAEITLAYEKPVRRIWAILGTSSCKLGAKSLSFDIVNRGGKDIAWLLNEDFNKPALAVKELKNPAIPEDGNGLVKIFTWDIAGVAPSYTHADQYTDDPGYNMIIVLEADDGNGNIVPTVTGLNEGYLFTLASGWTQLYPAALPGTCDTCTDDRVTDPGLTDIQNPVINGGIKISYMADGFNITGGEGWVIRAVTGLRIAAGKGNFVSKNGLPKGIYLLTVSNAHGGKETQKVIVR